MILQELKEKGLINPPSFIPTNTVYLTIIGSVAYGMSSDTSDMDVYGVCIPKKEEIFPHLGGEILGFGKPKKRFEQWQIHHIFDPDAMGGKGRTYDFQIFNIVKFFNLCMDSSPNCIDVLYTSEECVLHRTQIGNMIRENRHLFLSKKCLIKFKGYAFSQLHKMQTKNPQGQRKELKDKYGYEVKFAAHLVRLLDECWQILTTGTLDLMQNREHLKAIRRGEVSEEDVLKWVAEKEIQLEKIAAESKLPEVPDELAIKNLLLNCLEHHYGNLNNCIVSPEKNLYILQQIKQLLEENNI